MVLTRIIENVYSLYFYYNINNITQISNSNPKYAYNISIKTNT